METLLKIYTLPPHLTSDILSFLKTPPRFISKNYEFFQLVIDQHLLVNLKQTGLPLFDFLGQKELTPIQQASGIIENSSKINEIFRKIHSLAKQSLPNFVFCKILSDHKIHSISRYITMNRAVNQQQDNAICILFAKASFQFQLDSTIIINPQAIRAFFAESTNQPTLDSIEYLSLSNQEDHLYKEEAILIPPEIGQLIHITHFSIKHHNIARLPHELFELTKLKNLNLKRNRIAKLPAEIGQLAELEVLKLGYNELTELPDEIGALTKLSNLNLIMNELFKLPTGFFNLTNLKRANLKCNNISTLPAEIGKLLELRKLSLGYNDISQIPSEIGKLTNMEELYLRNNNILELPLEIINLTALYILALAGNENFKPPANDRIRRIIKSSPKYYKVKY